MKVAILADLSNVQSRGRGIPPPSPTSGTSAPRLRAAPGEDRAELMHEPRGGECWRRVYPSIDGYHKCWASSARAQQACIAHALNSGGRSSCDAEVCQSGSDRSRRSSTLHWPVAPSKTLFLSLALLGRERVRVTVAPRHRFKNLTPGIKTA
jgi:hypothetical protein